MKVKCTVVKDVHSLLGFLIDMGDSVVLGYWFSGSALLVVDVTRCISSCHCQPSLLPSEQQQERKSKLQDLHVC